MRHLIQQTKERSFEQETIWLFQTLMAQLFDRSKPTISEHLTNLFQEEELVEDSVVRNFRTTAADGKDWQTKLDSFLEFNDRNVIKNAGKISNKKAKEYAEAEYQAFAEKRRKMIEAEAERVTIEALEVKQKGSKNE